MCTHTRTCTSTGTPHRVRGLRARPFSNTPPSRQPHSVFGGYSRLKKKESLIALGSHRGRGGVLISASAVPHCGSIRSSSGQHLTATSKENSTTSFDNNEHRNETNIQSTKSQHLSQRKKPRQNNKMYTDSKEQRNQSKISLYRQIKNKETKAK